MKESESSVSAIVRALSQKESYPHQPEEVEVRQSHISYVFLAGPIVYKIKKPVRFSFLDYSTLDKRRHFCKEEVRLNRRLAPDMYLDVVPILESEGRFVLGDGAATEQCGKKVEYAVKMRRLPEGQMLDRLIKNGRVGKEAMNRVAAKLVAFHAEAGTEKATVYGAPEAIWQRWSDGFRETEPFVGRTIRARQYRTIADFSAGFYRHHESLLAARARGGRVREGHGDLRAEHVCLTDGIVIFDCIEFSAGLRTCDVSSELAFLAMDLEFLGQPALAAELVGAYEQRSGDKELSVLLPFYKCYRAYVRGKVESLKSKETEVPQGERETAEAQACRYFALACRYARGQLLRALIIVCGLAGSGKSTVARAIQERTGVSLMNSDITRKRLAGLKPTEHATQEFGGGIYSDAFTDLTYGTLLAEAENSLRQSAGVIVDATFQDAKQRRRFVDLAARLNVPLVFIECQASEAEILRRLEKRASSENEVSDATREVYLRQRNEFMPLVEVPADSHFVVRTDAAPDEVLDQLETVLDQAP
jgi:uncharacterized protein